MIFHRISVSALLRCLLISSVPIIATANGSPTHRDQNASNPRTAGPATAASAVGDPLVQEPSPTTDKKSKTLPAERIRVRRRPFHEVAEAPGASEPQGHQKVVSPHGDHPTADTKVSAELQETKIPRAARMAWWHKAKFGMFVHWGVYSVVGGEHNGQKLPNSAEWMMARGKISIADYQQYVQRFNPTEFDAKKFVGMAKDAGMKYLVITAKHHDGFSMFHSKATPYNVVDASPFGRDIMKELADACQEQDIRFGFYYSQAQDWHHPGGFGNNWDKAIKRVSNDQYVQQKAAPEVRQLLTEYGPIGIFWWDTPRAMSKQSFQSLHSLTKLQPNVITNDRLGEDFPGDYKTFERKIPARAPIGKDWEVCMPISGSWGYKKGDKAFKSSSTLIRNLVDIASKGGNYLLNVSPTGNGTLLPEAVERLKTIGEWMNANGEAIYGTTASPLGKLEWGRCTAKSGDDETELYLHVFDWPTDGKLLVPGLNSNAVRTVLLTDGAALKTETKKNGVLVSLPEQAPDEFVSVIKMTVSGIPKVRPVLPTPGSDGLLVLTADKAFIHNNEGSQDADVRLHDDIAHVGHWIDDRAWLEWDVNIDQSGSYEISGTMSVKAAQTNFQIGLAGQKNQHMTAHVNSTGGYGTYVKKSLGTIRIAKPGVTSIQVKPVAGQWQPMNLRQIQLRRLELP